jgi:hypothetical protein
MAFYSFRIGNYSRMIYLDGTRTFEQVAIESPLYEQAIKERAAKDFTYAQIDEAFAKGFTNQGQYDETLALKHLIEPRVILENSAS